MLRRTLGDGYSLLCHRSPDRKPDAFDSQRDNAARERLVKLSQSKETTAAVQSALGKLIDQHSIMENDIAEIGIGIENSPPFPATPEDIKFTEYSGKELCFTYDCREREQKPVCALGFFRVMSHVFLRLVARPDSPLLSPYIKQHRTIRYDNQSDPDVAILPTEFVPRSVDCNIPQLPKRFVLEYPSLLVDCPSLHTQTGRNCEVSSIQFHLEVTYYCLTLTLALTTNPNIGNQRQSSPNLGAHTLGQRSDVQRCLNRKVANTTGSR
jgi:hypothetical protein